MSAQPVPAVPPKLAATVLLLRDTPRGIETLLVRRHSGMAFMGGVWVFPGGKLEAADQSSAARARVPADARRRCEEWALRPGRPCRPEEAIGLYVAACRETFEEAGLLLAHHADGARCTPELVERVQPERAVVASQPEAFAALLEREGLQLDGTLIPWAHWVTPSLERIRFDARFFATSVPADLAVRVDVTESTDHAWMAPADALAACTRGEILLAGPTIVSLAEAAEAAEAHGAADALIRAEEGRSIAPIVPRLRREGDAVWAYQPWDPAYDEIAGEGAAPETALPERYRRFQSRMMLPGVEKRIVG